MRALLVYPEYPPTFWSASYALKLVGNRSMLPPLGLITVAAMLPRHWRPELVDLNIEALSDRRLRKADLVLLTGMQVQRRSLQALLRRCRRLGLPTVVGGPFATSEPDAVADATHLVLGEVEETLGGFCEAFEAGRAPRITPSAGKPDLRLTPVPRYDLLRRGAYNHMSLQYSRGCPFSCEFCDIIVLYGRNPRTKSAEQVEAELDALPRGFRGGVFIVDDNFIGNKKAVRTLLPRLRAWQERHGWPFEFCTEASLNLAEDPALMTAMTDAGFGSVFIGIESPSAESLLETRKNQNVRGAIDERVRAVQRQGLDVWGGFIIGFDHDRADIFDRQIELVERAAIPVAMVGLLTALPGTPLAARLRAAGRLRPLELTDHFGSTNVVTVLPERELLLGYRRVLETIYAPRAYFDRVLEGLRRRPRLPIKRRREHRRLMWAARGVIVQGLLGWYRRDYWRFLREVWRGHRPRLAEALAQAAIGHHFFEYTRRQALPQLGGALARIAPADAGGPPASGQRGRQSSFSSSSV